MTPENPPTSGIHAVAHRGLSIEGCLLAGRPHLTLQELQGRRARRDDWDGYRFYHLYELAPGVPQGKEWCLCYEDGAVEPTGPGQRDPASPVNEDGWGWYDGPDLSWMFVGRRVAATTDPELIRAGVPALTETQLLAFRAGTDLHLHTFSL